MNALPDPSTFATNLEVAEAERAFKVARDQLLDAFIELETAVARWLSHLEIKDPAKLLGQRIDQLASNPSLAAKARPKQAKRIRGLAIACKTFFEIRNASVHSTHEAHIVDGEFHIFFRSVEHRIQDQPIFAVRSIREIENAAKDAKRIATWLNLWLTQASSPPQP